MQHPTLFSVQKDHLLLTRSVKGRMRYYLLKIEETLFGEYLLEKVYGSMRHNSRKLLGISSNSTIMMHYILLCTSIKAT